MASFKRKIDDGDDNDILKITPLGGGQEVGRSCVMLEFKGKKIMLDCGIHPAYTGLAALPYFDEVDPETIDLLLVSHFHLDHCAALPYFLSKTTFKGRVFMTHPTKAIYRWMLSDYVRVSNISVEDMLYDEKDLDRSMEKIETVDTHQIKEIDGVKFWCYNAGHVLGACMFMIEIAGVRVLYTGDFSRQEDRHLMAAEIPDIVPDILIVESTYGVQIHEPRAEREARFTGLVHDIVKRGGRCLLPVFALGRAQELLLILDEYWEDHPELHSIPIYYASSLAKKCMSVYQTYINHMNDRIRRQFAISNPFVFRHISSLRGMEQFEDVGPSVVMASPGMLQSGLSRELFEMWCEDRRNGCVVTGYSVEGTLAKHILSAPKEVNSLSGQKLHLNMSVHYISFSAHSDFMQTSEYIDTLRPPNVVLVHGDANEMGRLKSALQRRYEDRDDYKLVLHNPSNCQSVELNFRGEKLAKAMGAIAANAPKDEQVVSGILVKKGFDHLLLNAADIREFTDIVTSSVVQRQCVPFHGPFS
eukprot:Opistho-2@34374